MAAPREGIEHRGLLRAALSMSDGALVGGASPDLAEFSSSIAQFQKHRRYLSWSRSAISQKPTAS
jgi:hypothetical protein